MTWQIIFYDDFEDEFELLSEMVQNAIYARLRLLEEFGPNLDRPHADTLNDSKHKNMKELRCIADNGVWRIAFAFDPNRHAILLVAGDKAGTNQNRFYKKLIANADKRFDDHLNTIKEN